MNSDRKMKVLTTVSGKGGVGKTGFSVNLAILASRQSKKVLLIDADLGLANVEILLGIQPRLNIGHVLEGSASLEDVVTKCSDNLSFMSAGSGEGFDTLSNEGKIRLLSAFENFSENFETVIIDAGAGIGEAVQFFAGSTREAILMVTPEPTSITDAYVTLKVLCSKKYKKVFHVIVNMAGKEETARNVFERLVRVSYKFLNVDLKYAGCIPVDHKIHESVMMAKPLVEAYPLSPAARSIREIAKHLLSSDEILNIDGGLSLFWGKLLRESMENKGEA